MSKVEEFIAESKLSELLHKNEAEKQKNTVIWVLAIIGQLQQWQRSHTRYTVSSHRIIWKTSKMISMMTLMIILTKTIRYRTAAEE